MRPWLRQIVDGPWLAWLGESLTSVRSVTADGAWGSSAAILAGALAMRTERPVLLAVAHLDDADEAAADIGLYQPDLPPGAVETFPALEVMPGETEVSTELLADRLTVASRVLRDDQPRVLVAPVQALMQAVPDEATIRSQVREVAKGETVDPAELVKWLTEAGYRRVDAVEEPGDFAGRGGIVDVFPSGGPTAFRIDFFGDEVDTIAEIDVESMGSGREHDRLRLVGPCAGEPQDDERTTSLWSLLETRTLVVLNETLELSEQARGYYERLTEPENIYAPRAVLEGLQRFPFVEANQFPAAGGGATRAAMPVRSLRHFDEDASRAVAELGELARGDDGASRRVVVLCHNEAEEQRLKELLAEHAAPDGARVETEMGYLFRGFEWSGGEGGVERSPTSAAVCLVPHHELFHRYATRRRVRQTSPQAASDAFFDLEPGDHVVHTEHGIARFRGLRTMRRKGTTEEYLTLEFAQGAHLHVPTSEIDVVHKYIGGFSGRPPLSKLGGGRWKKQKEEVREAVRRLAKELLQVQAARSSMPGIAYPEDSPWTRQFEAEFPYEETEDQLAAITAIKNDMADPQPADRLICGDVGYGKTELAMRAAFKAIEAGKQVAMLCPTTVLCEQHERNFRQRMAEYPVRIEALSRFRTEAQNRRVLRDLADGKVDMIIGTHRLLSSDVKFRDLGMVVIDEEQRFGVKDKSKLMRYRTTVDVLTLSATPIPRTLHMALMGLRDISNLSTPPADRRAVVTEVIPFDEQRIRQAVLRELNRGGQCYFVHNRVHNIHTVAADLQRIVPEARLIVGHGQMSSRELEDVMHRFLRGEADILVCTTIIESGIDIPSVNTMFISDCDRFGLAELHQLRGRVGRYKHRAYCYLLLPKKRTVSDVSLRRLKAIEDYSMLGAGFKIAMRDMEIRGVGNILGPEQSGHIAAVGYQMYCQLLEQSVAELKDQPVPRPNQAHLDLKVSGYLPKDWIPSEKHRMQAYRRIHQAGTFDAFDRVVGDLTGAYGEPPEPARWLLALAELRIALTDLDVGSLKLHGHDLVFATQAIQRLSPLLESSPGTVRVVDTPTRNRPGTIYFRPPAQHLEPEALVAILHKLLVRPLRPHQRADDQQAVEA